MTYNQANRLATVGSLGPFTYNADGQRTTKPAPSGTTVFHYSMDGLLLAETTEAGNLIRVYFWAEDMPIAQMDTELTYLHADHLDTPRIGTNSSGAIVWQWNSDAFGSLLPNEDPDGNGMPTTVNLRFPGQYFDKETNLHYNYFRDYDPKIGRYLESDPIGLAGGLNTFGYVGQNPLGFVDPTGENPALLWALGGALMLWDMLEPMQPNPKYPDAIESVRTIPEPIGRIKKSCQIGQEATSKPLLGKNVRINNGRSLTDLNPIQSRTTAKSIFRNQTRGQRIEQSQSKNGTIRRRSEDGTQIRMNPDGSTRLDLPGRGTQPNGETIHFSGQ